MPKKTMKRKASAGRVKRTSDGPSSGDLFTAAIMGGLVIAAAVAYTNGWGLDSFNLADFKLELPSLGMSDVPQSN